MSRFDHLEFEPSQKPSQHVELTSRADETHDEHYWMKQADAERRDGCHENALRCYSRALELDRSLVPAWLGQVQMLIALGEYPEADIWSRKSNELFRSNPELTAARAHALIRRTELREAQPLCDAALALEGKSPYPWMVRGELMLARRDSIEQHCFDKARQLCGDWLVCMEIADIYQHYHRTAKALALLRLAVEQNPDRAHCWYRQGACEQEMGLLVPARKSLTHCLELSPKHIAAQRCMEKVKGQRWSPLSFWRRLFRKA